MPSSAQNTAPSTSSTASPSHAPGIDAHNRNTEACLDRTPLLELRRDRHRTWRERGSRPARTARVPSPRKNATLSRASRTSGAVENCCRTPPSAFPLAPEAIAPDSARTTSRAPFEREMVGDRGADDAAACYDDASHRCELARLLRVRSRSGARTSDPTGTPRAARIRFIAAWRGKRSTAARSSASDAAPAAARVCDDRRDLLRERRGERRHGTDRAGLDAPVDQRLGADEDVEAEREVRLERVPGRVAHLQADEVRRLVLQPPQHVERDRIAARARELVDVERQRRARARRGREMRELRRLVEREVRRPDHGDGSRARLARRRRRARPCPPSSARRSGPRRRAARPLPRRTAAGRAAAPRPRTAPPRRSSRTRARRRGRPRHSARRAGRTRPRRGALPPARSGVTRSGERPVRACGTRRAGLGARL